MTFIVETFFSGCVSKVINDGKDYSWAKIKKAVNDRNDRNLSTRIYRVIENALNIVTDKKFKDTDGLYETIERIFIEFRDHGSTIESVKCGLGMLNSDVTVERCDNFLEKFYEGICQDKELHRRISLLLQEKGIDINQKEFQQLNKTVEYGFDQLDRKIDKIDEKISISDNNEDILQNKKPVKSRTQEYADKWEANMFLNNFDKRDQHAGTNVKLGEVYLEAHLPHYIWRENNENEPSTDLKELLSEYINEKRDNNMLLIFGQPGIGKSTLITWIVSNLVNEMDEVLVYQFASDLRNISWHNENVLDRILEIINLKYEELENKTIILDGFDEIRIGTDREKLLNRIYQEMMRMTWLKRFSIIVTCRENYVWKLQKIECAYITLQTWDDYQINSFCKVYGEKIKRKVSKRTIKKILENKEILGTPLILYMILALNITVEENGSIVDIYDQIFSLDGGSIYDRCIKNARFAEPHRISDMEIKQQIHQISQRIAFWIFENNAEEAFILQTEYEKICNAIIYKRIGGNEETKYDFLIGNYFRLIKHCEEIGREELHFVHRSIYEYFVAEYIFVSTYSMPSKKLVMMKLGELLKVGVLSEQILEFIKYKFDKIKLNNISALVKDIFQSMLADGLTYHINIRYSNIIDKEINIFTNMLEIVHLWNHFLGRIDNTIIRYLQYNNRSKLNLKGIILQDADLCRVYLEGANLNEANLSGSRLEKAYLNGTALREAHLEGANLQEAYLNRADLIGAYLRKVNLIEAKLQESDLSGADLIGAELIKANLSGTELISTKLIKANLSGANLSNAKLSRAELNGADLRGADLYGVELEGAYLRDVIFDERQVILLANKYDLSYSRVYIDGMDKIISYIKYAEEYCH